MAPGFKGLAAQALRGAKAPVECSHCLRLRFASLKLSGVEHLLRFAALKLSSAMHLLKARCASGDKRPKQAYHCISCFSRFSWLSISER